MLTVNSTCGQSQKSDAFVRNSLRSDTYEYYKYEGKADK